MPIIFRPSVISNTPEMANFEHVSAFVWNSPLEIRATNLNLEYRSFGGIWKFWVSTLFIFISDLVCGILSPWLGLWGKLLAFLITVAPYCIVQHHRSNVRSFRKPLLDVRCWIGSMARQDTHSSPHAIHKLSEDPMLGLVSHVRDHAFKTALEPRMSWVRPIID